MEWYIFSSSIDAALRKKNGLQLAYERRKDIFLILILNVNLKLTLIEFI